MSRSGATPQVVDYSVGRTNYDPDNVTLAPINTTYGDELLDSTLSGSWTPRNISGVDLILPKLDPYVRMRFDASGDGMWRAAPAGDFEIVTSLRGLVDRHGMVGPGIIDSSGAGVGFFVYDTGDAFVTVLLSSYSYSATGQFTSVSPRNHRLWLSLRKVGTTYTGRWSQDGVSWSSFTSNYTWAGTVDRIGVGQFFTPNVSPNFVDVYRFNLYAPTFTP